MNRAIYLACTLLLFARDAVLAAEPASQRYILLNLAAADIRDETLRDIRTLAESSAPGRPRLGVAAIISYFRHSPVENLEQLRRSCSFASSMSWPWLYSSTANSGGGRPDLWNWWDKSRAGIRSGKRGQR